MEICYAERMEQMFSRAYNGTAKYVSGDFRLNWQRYFPEAGDTAPRLALMLVSVDGEPLANASVNLPAAVNPKPEGHIWLKGWSENTGIPAMLEKCGIVELTGVIEPLPPHGAIALLAKILVKIPIEVTA